MENKQIVIAVLALVLLVPTLSTEAFASQETSVFNISVEDYDPNKNYKVCMSDADFEPIEKECIDIKGSEFVDYGAWFEYEYVQGDRFYAVVEDIQANKFAYKYFSDTSANPENVTISMLSAGPKQVQTQTVENEAEGGGNEEDEKDGNGGRVECEDVQDDCEEAEEKERNLKEAGGEFDGETGDWLEYDEDEYWVTEDE